MYSMKYKEVFLWIQLCTLQVTSWSCPEDCVCTQDAVECVVTQYKEVPPDLPANIFILNMQGNDLSYPDSLQHLPRLTHLKSLDISFCNIQNIPTGIFTGLHDLEEMYLSGNRFESLEHNLFDGLTLNRLILNNNTALSRLDTDVFVNSSIKHLEMNACGIQVLSSSVLEPLRNSLQNISVAYNKGPLILDGTLFTGFTLNEATFVDSDINTQGRIFSGTLVHLLDMSQNKIGNVVWTTLKHLKVVELYIIQIYCSILNVPEDFGPLRTLDVSKNSLQEINVSSLMNSPNLTVLILESCNIFRLPLDFGLHLPNVREMYLSHNKLTYLDPSWFLGSKIETLVLSHNLIQSITMSFVESLPSLKALDLEQNSFHCNCEVSLFVDWLQGTESTNINSGKCASPGIYKGKALKDLEAKELPCTKPQVIFITSHDVSAGKPLQLYCKSTGDPPPLVTIETPWNTTIQGERDHQRNTESVKLIHTLPRYNCSLQGNFTCIASNVAGTDREILNIVGSSCKQNTDKYFEKIFLGIVNVSVERNIQQKITVVNHFDDTLKTPRVTNESPKQLNQSHKTLYIIAITVIVVLLVIVLFLCSYLGYYIRMHRKTRMDIDNKSEPSIYYIKNPSIESRNPDYIPETKM